MQRDLLTLQLAQRREMLAWSRDALDHWIGDQLGELLDYAWSEVPLYRRLWQEKGISPQDFQGIGSFHRFPLVNKEILSAAGTDWIQFSRGSAGLCTKGTTGAPLVLWLNREDCYHTVPGVIMGFERSGMRHGMKTLLLSPAWHRMSTVEDPAARYLGANVVYAGGSILDAGFARLFPELLAKHRPAYVVAMTPLVLSLLRRMEEQGTDPRELFRSVRTLMVLGLPLTPGLRQYILDKTGVTEVWDRGGSTEGLAMDECENHNHQHIYEDTVYCEVVGADNKPVADGERGRLLLTKLVAGPSPVIRYDSEDLASIAPEPCSCGNNMRRLQLYGRADSNIRLADRYVYPWDVRCLMEQDIELAGRNMLLVRDAQGWRGVNTDKQSRLHLVMEGQPCNESALVERLQQGLGMDDVRISWTGKAALQWTFRQVVNRSELPFLDSDGS